LFNALGDKLEKGIGIEPLLKNKIVKDNYKIFPDKFPSKLSEVNSITYDYITMLAVLEHIPEELYTQLFTESLKLLKPGGTVIITVPSLKVDTILLILSKLKLVDGMSLEEHHGFVPEDTINIFKNPEFKLVKRKTFQLGLNNLFIFKRKVNSLLPQFTKLILSRKIRIIIRISLS
jgi:hypothetical protein